MAFDINKLWRTEVHERPQPLQRWHRLDTLLPGLLAPTLPSPDLSLRRAQVHQRPHALHRCHGLLHTSGVPTLNQARTHDRCRPAVPMRTVDVHAAPRLLLAPRKVDGALQLLKCGGARVPHLYRQVLVRVCAGELTRHVHHAAVAAWRQVPRVVGPAAQVPVECGESVGRPIVSPQSATRTKGPYSENSSTISKLSSHSGLRKAQCVVWVFTPFTHTAPAATATMPLPGSLRDGRLASHVPSPCSNCLRHLSQSLFKEYLPCVAITDALSSPARQDAVVERLAAYPLPNDKLHAEAQVIGPEGQPEDIGQEGQAGKGKAVCVWGAMRWLNDK